MEKSSVCVPRNCALAWPVGQLPWRIVGNCATTCRVPSSTASVAGARRQWRRPREGLSLASEPTAVRPVRASESAE